MPDGRAEEQNLANSGATRSGEGMNQELKSCPWCGDEAAISDYAPSLHTMTFYRPGCLTSGCPGNWSSYSTIESAIAAWNRRVVEGAAQQESTLPDENAAMLLWSISFMVLRQHGQSEISGRWQCCCGEIVADRDALNRHVATVLWNRVASAGLVASSVVEAPLDEKSLTVEKRLPTRAVFMAWLGLTFSAKLKIAADLGLTDRGDGDLSQAELARRIVERATAQGKMEAFSDAVLALLHGSASLPDKSVGEPDSGKKDA